ncbi:MAG: HAD family phosphatase [Clostridiales bacterium]|nr:HAD family phosphatase [Clostridiales bacterium]
MSDKYKEAGKKVKLIVSDIDGTLLTSDRKLTKENIEAIRKAKEQNIKFTLSTGRVASMIDYYIKTLEIDTPVITLNGAVVWDPVKKQTVSDIPMDLDELNGLLEFCKYHEMDYAAMTMGTNYFSKNSVRINRYQRYNEFAKSQGMSIMEVDTFDDEHRCIEGVKVYKILVTEKDPKRIKILEDYLPTLKKTGFTASEPGLLDIAEKTVNKGMGVKKLAEAFNLRPDEVCTLGDYDNDIAMLQYAGFSVAMGNALDNVKKHAFYVTATNDESGLAEVVEKYILR